MQLIEDIQFGSHGEIFVCTRNEIFGYILTDGNERIQQFFHSRLGKIRIEAFALALSGEDIVVSSSESLVLINMATNNASSYPCKGTATTILANNEYVVGRFDSELKIFQMSDLENVKQTVDGIPTNQELLDLPLALSTGGESPFLAFQEQHRNRITVKNIQNENYYNLIYETDVGAVAINPLSTQIAATSLCGTIVYVSNIETGDIVNQLHRGISPCIVSDLRYLSEDNIIMSSNRPTVHVFNAPQVESEEPSYVGYAASYFSSVASYLPSVLRQCSSVTCTIPENANPKSFISKLTHNKSLITVVTKKGEVTTFETNKDVREATKLRTFSLSMSPPKK